jgi:hypothetical protein
MMVIIRDPKFILGRKNLLMIVDRYTKRLRINPLVNALFPLRLPRVMYREGLGREFEMDATEDGTKRNENMGQRRRLVLNL